jgi:predicted ribosome quality control (RQC) complex YloA/Tae2 family protein
VKLRPTSARPVLERSGGEPSHPPLFPDIAADPETFAYSRALEKHFAALESERLVDERRRALEGELLRRRKKAEAACAKLRPATGAEAEARAGEAQRDGESLLAFLHLVRRGATEVELPDLYAGEGAPPRRIALDPALPAQEQAARRFKLAKRVRRGMAVAAERLARFEAEGAAAGAALAKLAGAASLEDLDAIARGAGIRASGLRPRASGGKTRAGTSRGPRPEARGPGRKFFSRDGLEILVGRTSAENDVITLRVARSNDLFFHVEGFPGSHVIVRAARGKPVPLETLLDAAALAVHYSKARDHARAEVSYTPRKWVRKPRGAAPGRVVLERHETLRVAPDGARLRRVLETSAREEDGPEPPDARARPRS